MLKRGQEDHNFIKGTSENKRNQRNNRKQNETKIEIELNEHQINNTNYDVQSCNNDEASNSKGINNEKDFDENTNKDEDKERVDANREATDSNCPDLYNRIDDIDSPSDSNSDSDSDSDSDIDNDNDEK